MIRLDDLNRNGLRIFQDSRLFCFGMDAVLLSGFALVKPEEVVLDIGTGTGVIPVLLTAKSQNALFYGLEIQKEAAALAVQSISLNNLNEQVFIVEGDIRAEPHFFKPSQFDVITCNPPYIAGGGGLKNLSCAKSIARHELLCSLEDIVKAGAALLKPGGRFYMVHRPNRLADLLCTFRKYGLEPKKLQLVHPFANKKPNMVLLAAVRGGRPELDVLSPLIIYSETGDYTEEAKKVYNG